MMGTITHFTATVTTYRMMSDPMMMHPGMMMPYREVPVQELRQFVLDMRSGKILPHTDDNVMALMASAPDLVHEFSKLRKKQRQQQLMLFIRRFNERYPLYFRE